MSTQITEWLGVVAKIPLRCWILGFLLLMIWFGFHPTAGPSPSPCEAARN